MKIGHFTLVLLSAVILFAACTSDEAEVRAVRLDRNSLEIVKGQSAQLSATVVPDQEAEFTWFSQDDNYVRVDENGLVTAVALKKDEQNPSEVVPVSVYVKYRNGADECLVTVLPLEPSSVEIQVEGNVVQMNQGQTMTLQTKCYPEDADITDVTWSTDYAAVATVNPTSGLIKAVAPGFAVIKAAYNDKIYDEITVQVVLAK
ncbi:MAG: Ig-like domain-containing protein [Bacteroidales bacterium]|nr:Ig-like domain-containing protein [Bacteroidales bacterium]